MAEIERFSIETNSYFGDHASESVPKRLRELGYQRPGIIIDKALAGLNSGKILLKNWASQELHPVQVFCSRANAEPDYDYLDEVADQVRPQNPDVLLGIGGGSTLDLAKAVGILLRNEGSGIDYRGMDNVRVPGVPVVLLPTTAGTGSEVTKTASFIDLKSKTKLGINGRYVGCLFSILDPAMLITCPRGVTVSAGLDALVHAVEAVTAKTANSLSILFGLEAIRLLFAGLPGAVERPDDCEARGKTLLGSHYAGIAMWNAGGGPASGVSYPLGVHFGVPHGFAGGILLPHVIAMNVDRGYTSGYARIFERLDGANSELKDDAAKAANLRDRFFDLYRQINAPQTLGGWGIGRKEVPFLTELTMDQRKANLELNPVQFGRKDVILLLESVSS